MMAMGSLKRSEGEGMQKFAIKKTKEISAVKENVWKVLLTPELFSEWGEAFCPDSKMKGDWKKEGMITYTDNKGMGLKGKVLNFEPNAKATIKYVAVLNNFKESTEEKEGWIGCQETYTLSEKNGVTTLSVESEVPTKEFYNMLAKSWDEALQKIKELSEKNSCSRATKVFLNLPVNNLEKSKKFFTALGYSINPEFTDDNAACVVISDSIYVMLLVKKFFKTFVKKEIADSSKQTEAIIALSATSKSQVDEMAKKAVAAGGKIYREPEDHGWMYGQSFEDLDGHLWEIFWMDSKRPSEKK